MGQSSIILGIAATVILGLLLFASQRTNNKTDEALVDYTLKVLSREAAVTGMNLTVRKLVDDPEDWTTGNYGFAKTSYHNAEFSVAVSAVHADTVDIRSTGTDDAGIQIIEARFAKGYSTIAVPPAFKYAIISELDLTLNGQAEILAVDEAANANIHANGDLTSNGNQIHVEGYGSFDAEGGSGTVNPEKAIDDIFDPNDDTNGDGVNLIEGENIDVPELIPDDYDEQPLESDSVTVGNLDLTGIIDVAAWGESVSPGSNLGTANNPFRLFVEGDLTLSGGVTMLGYIQVVTRGSINISGNVTSSVSPVPDKNDSDAVWDAWTQANLDASGNTKIGWYAGDTITLSGTSSVVGQLFANNSISLNGGGSETMNVIGGVTSANVDINVNGGMVIRYAEISEKVVIPGFTLTVPEGVRLLDWVEW